MLLSLVVFGKCSAATIAITLRRHDACFVFNTILIIYRRSNRTDNKCKPLALDAETVNIIAERKA